MIASYPRVLLLSPEYDRVRSVDRPTFDESEPMDQRRDRDDDIEPPKGVKRKNLRKWNPRSTKRLKATSESTAIYAQETSGFRILRRMKVENQWYVHICSVFGQLGHLWTVVTYKGRTWVGGKEEAGRMTLYGEDEFVTQLEFMGARSYPVIHAYASEKGGTR